MIIMQCELVYNDFEDFIQNRLPEDAQFLKIVSKYSKLKQANQADHCICTYYDGSAIHMSWRS
jgi:hypothetical protein